MIDGDQIIKPDFLTKTLPELEENNVRLVHTRPGFENLSNAEDAFDVVSSCMLGQTGCTILGCA